MPNTITIPEITIPEIARLLSVTQSQVSHIATRNRSTMPKPLYKRGRILYFDRTAMREWVDARIARMAGNAVSGRRKTDHEGPVLDNVQAQLFLRGGFDRKELRDKAQLKLMATKYCRAVVSGKWPHLP